MTKLCKGRISNIVLGFVSFSITDFYRNSPSFNKEVYVDFVAAQIKTLSFLAFIIRAYQVSKFNVRNVDVDF